MVLYCALNALEFIVILERMSHASALLILMIGRKLPLYAALRLYTLLLLSFTFGLLFGFFQLLSCLFLYIDEIWGVTYVHTYFSSHFLQVYLF